MRRPPRSGVRTRLIVVAASRARIVTRQLSVAVSWIRGVARRSTRPLRATRMRTRGDVRSGNWDPPGPGAGVTGGSGGGSGRSTHAPGAPSCTRSTLPFSETT